MADVAERTNFFSLPRELRDMIYRLVLVKEEPIAVTSDGHERESLIATSKFLRHEALDVFYFENSFNVSAPSYGLDTYSKFANVFEKLHFHPENKNKRVQVAVNMRMEPHWKNLMSWLQLYHSSKAPEWVGPEDMAGAQDCELEELFISGLFVMVKSMRNMPWANVEKVLRRQRMILEELETGWDVDDPSD